MAATQKRMNEHMLLGQLITNEVTDPHILHALQSVPREDYLPENLRGTAYVDEDLPLGGGRFLLEPLTFARMLNLAQITEGCRVLIVGCGTGYSIAVINRLAHHTVAVDSDETLLAQARAHAKRLKLANIDIESVKSMAEGYAQSAPYNVILVEGALEVIPEHLSSQLAKDGRLVAVRSVARRPGSLSGLGKLVLARRIEGKTLVAEHFDTAASLLPGFEAKQAFSL